MVILDTVAQTVDGLQTSQFRCIHEIKWERKQPWIFIIALKTRCGQLDPRQAFTLGPGVVGDGGGVCGARSQGLWQTKACFSFKRYESHVDLMFITKLKQRGADGAHRSPSGDTTHDFNCTKPFTHTGRLYDISMASVCYVPGPPALPRDASGATLIYCNVWKCRIYPFVSSS